jgi:hypothetical protein
VPVSWQPPLVKLERWTGNRTAIEQAVASTTLKVTFADSYCVVMKPTGGQPDVNIAKQGEWICLNDGSVLSAQTVRERWPGAIP